MKIHIKNLSYDSTPTIFHKYSMIDRIRDFNHSIESGKIYGLVGSIGTGGWLLSYLLAGKDPSFSEEVMREFKFLITIDGEAANNEILKSLSCYVGEGVTEIPYKKYKSYPKDFAWKIRKIKSVANQISEGIAASSNTKSLEEIANLFELTGLNEPGKNRGRIHRPLEFNSGEKWRASLAIGYAYQKKLYCSPWLEPHGISYILGEKGKTYLHTIRDSGASIIIPVSNQRYIVEIADEIIHLNEINLID